MNGNMGGVLGDFMKKKISKEQKIVAEHLKVTGDGFYHRIPLPYHSLNADGVLVDVNDLWLETFGYLRKDVINKPFTNLLTEEYSEIFEDNFSFFIEKGMILGGELEILTKNKKYLRMQIDGIVDYDKKGNFIQTRCFLRDITMEYNAEMELHRLAARNSALLGAVPEIIMEVNSKKVYVWSNQAGLDFFGPDVIGKNAEDFFIGEQNTLKQVKNIFNGNDKAVYVESWQKRMDGKICLLGWCCNTLMDENGDVKGALSSARDITDIFQKQERINHLNAMLLGIRNVNRLINKENDPEKLLEGVCNNLAGRMGFISAWGAIFAQNKEKAVYVTHAGFEKNTFSKLEKRLLKGDLPSCVKESIAKGLLTIGNQKQASEECPVMAHDAPPRGMITAPLYVKENLFAVLTVSIPLGYIDDEVVSLFGEVARDVALAFEKIETEKELKHLRREQQKFVKLESLGIMAGGIAHDFNNLLVGILGNVSLAKLALNPDDPVHEYLDSAEIASRRARDLTQQLLTFSKGGSPIKREVQIASLLRESIKIILHDPGIKARFTIAKDLHNVSGDESQLDQVINNLFLNACEAMPQGGTIKISAENITVDASNRSSVNGGEEWDSVEGKYVKIRIADSGSGMDDDIIEKIFDPYFTTKSRGSGLGLSSVFSIIKSHNGMISVKSKPKKGTTFSILLPVATPRKKKGTGKTSKKSKLLEQANILIMDDEALVRNVLSGFLCSFKCRTKTAEHGKETIKLYKKALTADPFDIVILDLNVPGKISGIETAEKLLKINPKAKIIVSSGYSDEDAIAHYKKYGFIATLRKPYTIEELKNTLEHVLK